MVWAGAAERCWPSRLPRRGRIGPAFAPPTTLTELAALARRARLFIGADTGPLHLAAAVGTPCVGLYGPWPASRHGPYGSQNIALQQMFFEGLEPRACARPRPRTWRASRTADWSCEACDRNHAGCRLAERSGTMSGAHLRYDHHM